MTEKEIYEVLNEIFQNVFMDRTITVTPETCAEDIEDWDSLMHITLVTEVEKAFGVKFSARQAAAMKNVGEMAAFLEEQRKK